MVRHAAIAALVIVTFGGCTFGGLSDYDIARCDAATSQSADPCDRLNEGTSCTPYQCDAASGRCVQRPRDDDRDGDVSEACGGGDCVDEDPRRSSLAAGAATEIWKAGELPPGNDLTLSEGIDEGPAAAFVNQESTSAKCIQIVRLAPGGGPVLSTCSVLRTDRGLAPRQPFARLLPSGAAATFVATAGCAAGRVGFAYGTSSTQSLTQADCSAGAALPAFATTTTDKALIAYFVGPPQEREDAAKQCASPTPFPLSVAVVAGATTSSPSIGSFTRLSASTRSVRPPSLARVSGFDGALVASPEGDGVGVWLVSSSGAIVASAHLEIANARAVSVAVHQASIALVVEVGCKPQSIAFAVGTVDSTNRKLDFSRGFAVVAEAGTEAAVKPSVAWVEERGGWLATWILGGPKAMARRLKEDGTPWAGAYAGAEGASAAVAAGDSLYVFRADQPSGNAFLQSALRCP
jgi:hypothetical protein